jgi:hypothetical protein
MPTVQLRSSSWSPRGLMNTRQLRGARTALLALVPAEACAVVELVALAVAPDGSCERAAEWCGEAAVEVLCEVDLTRSTI